MNSYCLTSLLIGTVQAQILFFTENVPFLFNRQPFNQQPFNQQLINQQPFNQQLINQQPVVFPPQTSPRIVQTTTTAAPVERIEDVPNPDLEPGIFPVPDPRSWPLGPDWNDPRNTWTAVNGWTSEKKQTNSVELQVR